MEKSTAQLVDDIRFFQRFGMFHEMTCGVDSQHALLAPKVVDDVVSLVCPICGYEQNHIPDLVIGIRDSVKRELEKDIEFGTSGHIWLTCAIERINTMYPTAQQNALEGMLY